MDTDDDLFIRLEIPLPSTNQKLVIWALRSQEHLLLALVQHLFLE